MGRSIKICIAALSGVSLLTLAACGGSSINPTPVAITPPPPPANAVPSASVTASQENVLEGQDFTLDASASTDPDGDSLTYAWRQISGTAVTIDAPSLAVQNLTAALIDADETLEFEVKVSDGMVTTTETISINALDIAPQETNRSAGSSFFSIPFNSIIALEATADDGYLVTWGSGVEFNIASSVTTQKFTENGTATGEETENLLNAFFPNTLTLDEVIVNDGELYILGTNRNEVGASFAVPDLITTSAVNRGFVSAAPITGFSPNLLGDVNANTVLFSTDSAAFGTNQIVNVAAFDGGEFRDIFNFSLAPTDFNIEAVIVAPDLTETGVVLNAPTAAVRTDATVTSFSNSTFVGLWSEDDIDGDGFGLRLQRADSLSALLGATTNVNENTGGNQDQAHVATTADDRAFIAWRDASGTLGDADGTSIKGRVLQADGTFVTNEFLINTTVVGDQSEPFVTPIGDDQALVVWLDESTGATEIRGIAYNSDGVAMSGEILIATGAQALEATDFSSTVLNNGHVVLGWANVETRPTNSNKLDVVTNHTVILGGLGE